MMMLNTSLVPSLLIAVLLIPKDATRTVKITIINSPESFENYEMAQKAVVIAFAPWSVHSELTREKLLSSAFDQAMNGNSDVSFFVVTEEFFASFLERLSKHEVKGKYDARSRERGAYLLKAPQRGTIVVDPENEVAANTLKEMVKTISGNSGQDQGTDENQIRRDE